MEKKSVSVFIDESGVVEGGASRFYIVAMVVHDRADGIGEAVENLDRALGEIGIANMVFHAGPLIHANDQFAFMNWDLRRRIFSRMMAFANRVPFRYGCAVVDKRYADSAEGVRAALGRRLGEVLDSEGLGLGGCGRVKVYYDCGQKALTNLLHGLFAERGGAEVEFAQAVKAARYKLAQVADLVCCAELMAAKLEAGVEMSRSERKFFGGAKAFRRNVLRALRKKRSG